jgi:hypothetical protein
MHQQVRRGDRLDQRQRLLCGVQQRILEPVHAFQRDAQPRCLRKSRRSGEGREEREWRLRVRAILNPHGAPGADEPGEDAPAPRKPGVTGMLRKWFAGGLLTRC